MPLADTKKRQTFLNLLKTQVVDRVDEAVAVLVAINAHGEIANHFTAGQIQKLTDWGTALNDIKNDAVATAIRDNYSTTHASKAVAIPGVND